MPTWVPLVGGALIQVVALAVFITRLRDKTEELTRGQSQLHSDLEDLTDSLNKRELVEVQTGIKLNVIETELASLRAWRHSFAETVPVQLEKILLRLETLLPKMEGRKSL